MDRLMNALFDLTPDVRYVAVYRHGELSLRQRSDLSLASAPESDRYEELLVNPTVLTLTRQRGEQGSTGVPEKLLGDSIHTHLRVARSIGASVDLERILHPPHKLCVCLWHDRPLPVQMRLHEITLCTSHNLARRCLQRRVPPFTGRPTCGPSHGGVPTPPRPTSPIAPLAPCVRRDPSPLVRRVP